MKKQTMINGCKILKKGIKSPDGKYSPAWYRHGRDVKGQDGITVYARCILKPLPKALGNVQNNTDSSTDYFESDRIRFNAGTPEFTALLPFSKDASDSE